MKRTLLLCFLLPLLLVGGKLVAQQAPNFSGTWIVSEVTNGPWFFTLTQDGTTITGSVQQSGGPPGPAAPIFEGIVAGSNISFKTRSGDGSRVITFTGTFAGDSIAFKRSVENVRPSISGAGLFGSTGASEFTAKRRDGAGPTSRVPAIPPVGATIGGVWQTTEIPGGPWVFEFTPSDATLIGTVRQLGGPPNPISLAAGKTDGKTLSFRVLSPDGERVLTFSGRLSGTNNLAFVREVHVLPDGKPGGNDLYGSAAPMQFTASRVLAR